MLLACIAVNMLCMEQPCQDDIGSELVNFNNWPDELMVYLFSFIPEATSVQEIFEKLAPLSVVNSQFKQIATDQLLLRESAKRYIKLHPQEAQENFLESGRLFLDPDNSEKEHTIALKILTALAFGVSKEIKNNMLIYAASKDNKDLVKILVNSGADINASNNYGNTPLIVAATSGKKEMVELLLDNNADINTTNTDNATALHCSFRRSHKELVHLLLDRGADVNSIDKFGQTILSLAILCNAHELVRPIFEKGPDVNQAHSDGYTLLIMASMFGYKEIAELLINAGADVNATDKKGYTALMYATGRPGNQGYKEIVELLLSKGADINVVNSYGSTALLIASQEGNRLITDLLENHITKSQST